MKLELPKNLEHHYGLSEAILPSLHQNILWDASALGLYGGDTNLYRFVGDDPIDATDPSGLIKKSNQAFWDTDYGKKVWADIQKAAEQVKERAKLLIAATEKLDPEIKKKYAKEIKDFVDRMQYIIDNVDSVTISVNFAAFDRQATPSGKNDDRHVGFYLLTMYNLMDEKDENKLYSKGKGKENKILSLPLPGFMGMSGEELKGCNKQFFAEMERNDRFRKQDGLPMPKIVRWNTGQIAALLANEMMHFFDFEGKGKYSIGGEVKKQDRVFLPGGESPSDFYLSLQESNWYKDLGSSSQIMQAIYYMRLFWEPLKPKN